MGRSSLVLDHQPLPPRVGGRASFCWSLCLRGARRWTYISRGLWIKGSNSHSPVNHIRHTIYQLSRSGGLVRMQISFTGRGGVPHSSRSGIHCRVPLVENWLPSGANTLLQGISMTRSDTLLTSGPELDQICPVEH